MPAPDLTPPPEFDTPARALHVHLHVRFVTPEALAGGVVIVIDQLRASVTIAAALGAGASAVVPALTVGEARQIAASLIAAGVPTQTPSAPGGRPAPSPPPHRGRGVLLGGERGGVKIEGFDLGNSPSEYTPDRVADRTIVFTTSNGTAALLHARQAARVLVGSLANVSGVCRAVAEDARPVHILCCGTRGEVSLDDVLAAGALVERLVALGRGLMSDDSGRVALRVWRGAVATPGGVLRALAESRGGRNLERQGLGSDVAVCARVDSLPVVPEFDPRTGRVTRAGDDGASGGTV